MKIGRGGIESRAGQPIEQGRLKGGEDRVNEATMVGRIVGGSAAVAVGQGQGVGLLQAGRGLGELAACVLDLGESEKEVRPVAAQRGGIARSDGSPRDRRPARRAPKNRAGGPGSSRDTARLQGRPKMGLGFGQVAHLHVEHAEIVMGDGQLGVQPERRLIPLPGLLEPALLVER